MIVWLFRAMRGVCTDCGGKGEVHTEDAFFGSWADPCPRGCVKENSRLYQVDRYRRNPPRHEPGCKIPCFDSPVDPGLWNVRSDHECDALRLTSPDGKSNMVALLLDQPQTPGNRDNLAYCLQMSLRRLSK